MNTKKIVMLRLRNRVLNRFKASKKTKTITKVKPITKTMISILRLKSGKKCLRVITSSGQPSVTVPAQKPPSPVKSTGVKPPSPVRLGARTVAALQGHRRICLRNRRLMGQLSPRAHTALSVY